MNQNAYVYRITNSENGKYYIGSSYKKSSHPSDLGVSYFTSSKIVKRVFGASPESFVKEVLFVGFADDAIALETELLKHFNVREDPASYNCHNNECNLNSRKIGEMTKDLGIGVHARTKEKMSADGVVAGRASCAKRHARKDESGKSLFAKSIGIASHREKDASGKSIRMISVGQRAAIMLHARKTEDGKSEMVMRTRICAECGFTSIAMLVGKHQKITGHSGIKVPK